MRSILQYILVVAVAVMVISCSDKYEESATELAPTITLDSATDSYQVVVDGYITIAPTYENVQSAQFEWRMSGEVISTDSVLIFLASQVGIFYIELEVTNSAGSAYKELRIEVIDSANEGIDFGLSSSEYAVGQAIEFSIYPTIPNSDDTTQYAWSLDGEVIATTKNLSYTIDQLGEYTLSLTATYDDGKQITAELDLSVVDPESLPFSWDFEKLEYNLAQGREVRIKCWNVANNFGGDYVWSLDGAEVQRGSSNDEYIFEASVQGTYTLKVQKYNRSSNEVASQTFALNVCPTEGTYKRQQSSSSSASSNTVYEFSPAPGQFVNFGYTASTALEACTYAQERLTNKSYISLGGFGGCIVVGFDHSIENSGDYDIEILGNPSATSNEPGIVMVMQDENGDGMPNDTWYELKGSETVDGAQQSDFSIKYYRPTNGDDMSATYIYTTNYGDRGTISKSFYYQDYWPAWINSDTITLYGTSLVPRSIETSPNYWINAPYDWGYVDNYSDIDILSESAEYIDTPSGNHFRISDAVDYKGESVNLNYIDFVKIYSATCAQSGWLGELSTEVLHIGQTTP